LYATLQVTEAGGLARAARQLQWRALLPALLALAALGAVLAASNSRLAFLLMLGALCGLTLYHAAFGFSAAYRRLLFARDVAMAQAQLVMLALATVLFAPVLAAGSAFGILVTGANGPFGWQVAIGAFLFGIGMQLGGGCASGTLYALGGGSIRMLATLAAFCAGGFAASLQMDLWQRVPDAGEIVLGERLGWPAAVALQLALLGMLHVLLRVIARPRQSVPPVRASMPRGAFTGPWPLFAGAILLACLNLAVLLVSGHPWSITWGFTLWAAKTAVALGWNASGSPFWQGGFQHQALAAPMFADETSVMDIGIVLGALIAAAMAGRFAPVLRVPLRSLAAALIGGTLMGYGARLAYGCNIGAFFSGVASTSLHGWLWIAAALPGNWIGARLRPAFGMSL
jgi:uncharacterized protein